MPRGYNLPLLVAQNSIVLYGKAIAIAVLWKSNSKTFYLLIGSLLLWVECKHPLPHQI